MLKKGGNGDNADALSFYVDPVPRHPALTVTILMARHGTHDEVGHVLSGRSEIALNAVGRKQAERLAARLCNVSIDTIHSSPRRRARETAEVIGDSCGLEPILVPGLDEIDFGDWTGQSFADLQADVRWRSWNKARGRSATPSGDTMAQATMRAMRHLESYEGLGVMLCVSHCDIIRGLVAHYLGMDMDRLLSFDIDPASVTTIQLAHGSGRVVACNERFL